MVEGTQVGAYRILHRIGSGGMGEVWMAEHAMLGRRAAIKVLHAEYSSRPEIVTRFFNEARAATAIADPGIIQIFDFGNHTDGSAYIVMELLDGETLDQRLRRYGVMAAIDALRIMRQVAGSLGAAHARGIVHRDLKPENIFLVRDPEVPGGERAKILDFGIAKLVGDTNVKTNTSAVMGTPTFMSPEQCRGAGQVDQRSDVYSLGCVLHMLITGRPPFDAEGVGDIIAMHLREPAPRTSSRVVGLSPAADALIARCLEKDPAMRFASGSELAAAISAVIGTAPSIGVPAMGDTTPVPMGAAPTTLSAASGMSVSGATPTRSRSWLAVGVAVVALGGGVAFVAVRRSNDAAATPPLAPAPAPAPTPRTPAPKPSAPDPNAAIVKLLTSFVAWSRDHVGEPCPDAAALGGVQDPWGHPIQITCTDQPADQIIGAVSAGPDGVIGTADDIASWQLDRDVSAIVRGKRWIVATPKHAPAAAKVTSKKVPSTPTKPATPEKPATNGLQLDENGMPIAR